ncbi:MAG: M23 family metallopeptidase [Thalassobaculaceae bacterium]
MVGKSKGSKAAHVKIQKQRGAIPTGTYPTFAGGANCPKIDSETWAIDYTHKRGKPALHKGIDIPRPNGTPILAVADGTVVGKFKNFNNRKGIEVMLRHTPAETGLPFFTYTQYTHLREMSPLVIGARVKKGAEIGKTSNTGKMGRRVRRDALHFAVVYSRSPNWTNNGRVVAAEESFWMDPVAYFKDEGPYDSQSIKRLDAARKAIDVPYVDASGQTVPATAKRVWPYACK